MNSLFKLLAITSLVLTAGLSTGHAAPAPVDLELTSTSGLASETITSLTGSASFSLDIDVQDPTAATTGTQVLGGFDITLSALPTGLTFNGYSNLVTGFIQNNSTGLSYSASANGTGNDISIGATQTTLLVANFTATKSGTYNLDFVSPGLDQELSNGSGQAFNYTDIGNTALVTVAPEPTSFWLSILGLVGLGVFAFGFRQSRAGLAA